MYQSQQNYPGADFNGGGIPDGGIAGSISNFISNVGQSAAGLLNGGGGNEPLSAPYRPQYPGQGGPPQQQQQQIPRPGTPNNPIGQFARAIEEITRNDDFQCIPKVICQMMGSQRRLPAIFGTPIFSA